MSKQLSKKKVKDALTRTKGAVYLAARYLNCSHTAIYNYLKKYPDIQEIKNHFEEEAVDVGEHKLREAVLAGEPWAIKYLLSTKGKGRGYVEKFQGEISGPEGEPIRVIEVVGVEPESE